MPDFTLEDVIAAGAARAGIALPFSAIAQIGAALTATGGPLSAAENAHFGTTEPTVTVNAAGEVKVSPKLAKIRQLVQWRQPRSPARRVLLPAPSPRARSRAPKRRRAAGTKTAASRAGPNGDPDPEPRPLTAVPEIQTPIAASVATAKVRPMSRQVILPMRAVQAVLVLRERDGDGWLALSGSHRWVFGSREEARRAARRLARNRGGLPVRELMGGAA